MQCVNTEQPQSIDYYQGIISIKKASGNNDVIDTGIRTLLICPQNKTDELKLNWQKETDIQ